MKVYNLEKTQILENYDLTKGYLTQDTITTHYPAVQGRKGRGHYETLREYPNGGKDVKWVVDVEEIKAEEAHDVVEDIYVFHPYETADLQKIEAEKEIISLKQKLAKFKEDVEQVKLFDMQRDDFDEKKITCANIIIRLRELEKIIKE